MKTKTKPPTVSLTAVKSHLADPTTCIYCKSTKLALDEFGGEGLEYRRRVDCGDCGQSWIHVFQLRDVEGYDESLRMEIDFSDLSVEVIPDDHRDAPWEDMDGYDHELVSCDHDGETEAVGYVYGSRRGAQRVVLKDPASYGTDEFLHARGASKQVAFEAQKENERRTKEQIAGWHNNGWEYWGVVVKFEGRHIDSCWGFDDAEYGEQEVVDTAIWTLEKEGYVITNKPTRKEPRMIPGNVHWFDHGNTEGERHEFDPKKRDRKPLPLP